MFAYCLCRLIDIVQMVIFLKSFLCVYDVCLCVYDVYVCMYMMHVYDLTWVSAGTHVPWHACGDQGATSDVGPHSG